MNQIELRKKLTKLLEEFDSIAEQGELRDKVKALIPVYLTIRDMGKSMIPNGLKTSARDRLLTYFRYYPYQILHEHELALVAGISEWARRVRELRVQFGWKIVSGITAKEMIEQQEFEDLQLDPTELGPNDYMLLDIEKDKESAYRWNVANDIRKSSKSMRNKIIDYLRMNVGKQVSGEELRYVAQGTEWARRVRELRTEEGWPITTKNSGRPELPRGVYVLEQDRQLPKHDRNIPETVRRKVMRRDGHKCKKCGWAYSEWNPSDPRFLEVHHIKHHVKGGKSDPDNLITVCNVCHDEIHKFEK